MSTLNQTSSPHHQHAYWGGIFAMTLCVFVLIASEFMPVSLLTLIARDLGVTEGLAGQGIAISIALGSTAGGIVFDHLGWQSTFAMSSVLLLCAGVLTFFTARQKAGAS